MTVPLALAVLAFAPMLLEARRSRANEAALRRAGAVEPAGDVYAIMQIAYPVCFLAMTLECLWRGGAPGSAFALGAVTFGAGKALKYWAIHTLGRRWTFRVLVQRPHGLVGNGPYRLLRHPNYAGVAGELAGFALMAGALLTGTAAVLGFGALLLRRIRIEERALGLRPDHIESSRS